jgi:cellulose synthase/poly-beta-1,6-N-acetylglucosamine synthase-like glycosyltransferase
MDILPIIYLAYMFLSLYFLTFFLIIYYKNKKEIFTYPIPKQNYSVSFIVPAYNEGKTIEACIRKIFELDYKNIKEVIVVNDCSIDNTKEILDRLLKEFPKLIAIHNRINLGNAAKSQNVGLKHATGEIIAIVDADSFPAKDSISKMVGYFDNPKVGAVTCPVVVRNKNNFLEKLQSLEYLAIAFGRKLMEYVDAIYVVPGPLALYRKEAMKQIEGFDENNMTQDIESTWHVTKKGWERKMSLSTNVSSTVPSKWKNWWIQRRRWNIGGLQCIWKYKKDIGKQGMLGLFIIPFFIISLFLGVIGLSIFFYLMISKIISKFLLVKYSLIAQTPLVTLNEFYITPNFLNYLGIILFLFGLIYLLMILLIMKEKIFIKENILNIPFYLIIYLMIYPFILIDSIYFWITNKGKWR